MVMPNLIEVQRNSYKQFLEEMNSSYTLVYKTKLKSDYELNRIIFGAPGTGKSFTLNTEKEMLLGKDSKNYELLIKN